MNRDRTNWWDKVRYAHKNTDLFDKITGIAVLIIILIAGYDLYLRYRPLNLVEIASPVLLQKEEYAIGELVVGEFVGEINTDAQPLVTRNIICDDNSYALTDRTATGGRRTLNGNNIAIARLSADDLKQVGANFSPDTDCYIKFTNIYTFDLPITGKRTETVRYFSDTFNIVGG